MPFYIRGPGIPAGRVLSYQANMIDIAPTLLSLAGGTARARAHVSARVHQGSPELQGNVTEIPRCRDWRPCCRAGQGVSACGCFGGVAVCWAGGPALWNAVLHFSVGGLPQPGGLDGFPGGSGGRVHALASPSVDSPGAHEECQWPSLALSYHACSVCCSNQTLHSTACDAWLGRSTLQAQRPDAALAVRQASSHFACETPLPRRADPRGGQRRAAAGQPRPGACHSQPAARIAGARHAPARGRGSQRMEARIVSGVRQAALQLRPRRSSADHCSSAAPLLAPAWRSTSNTDLHHVW